MYQEFQKYDFDNSTSRNLSSFLIVPSFHFKKESEANNLPQGNNLKHKQRCSL